MSLSLIRETHSYLYPKLMSHIICPTHSPGAFIESIMQFNKGKGKVLHLGRNNHFRHWSLLGPVRGDTALKKMDLGVLLDIFLEINQDMPWKKKCLMKHCPQLILIYQYIKINTSLFVANEVSAGVLCPDLGSPVLETLGHTGQSSEKGHKYG